MNDTQRKIAFILLWMSLSIILHYVDGACIEYYQRESRYSTRCGFIGWKKCYKTRYHKEARCCSNWRSMPSCTQALCWGTWNWCPNGGQCVRPNYCDCPNDNYYSPKCDHCTLINNCLYDQYHCTTSTDQKCKKCEHEYGGERNAYLPKPSGSRPNRICEKQCSWRPDSLQCYPGNCTGSVTTCACAPGFGGNNCMTINDKADITYCIGRVSTAAGDYIEADCHNTTSPTVYTNLPANNIKVDWKSKYEGPSQTTYERPYYINDYSVGVVDMNVEWEVRTLDGAGPVMSGTIACSGNMTADDPGVALHECDLDQAMTGGNISNGHILTFHTKSLNGGFLLTDNYDGGVARPAARQYYTGTMQDHVASFTFDFEEPTHCSVTSSCQANMLDTGPPFTKQNTTTIRWAGWEDAISEIKQYELEVYKMRAYGDTLAYKDLPISQTMFEVDETLEKNVTILEPGMYCMLLTISDGAGPGGNHRLARRFVLFDDVNTVSISQHDQEKMWVSSAAANTSHLWITSLDKPVVTKWAGHFFNEFHRTHKLLNAIEPHTIDLKTGYEERTGQPPITRSMEQIPNAHAIVQFHVVYKVDHQGGRSIVNTPPESDFKKLTDVLTEQWATTIPRSDGDSIRIWTRAYDVLNNTALDQVLVHVDASPPIIEDIWINRNGTEQLAVHYSKDLFAVRFDFTSFDHHSGLKEIEWELHDTVDNDMIHGTGHLPVRQVTESECQPPDCYCIPKDNECYHSDYIIEPDWQKMDIPHGDHDFDYYLKITVTNNAQLQTVDKYKISIDVSPPVAGVVHDGPGTSDIDFQQSRTIRCHWSNFFDRESGIILYQYTIAQSCLDGINFYPSNEELDVTEETYAELDVDQPGTYHCTVVAYNAAMEPSQPVCSDGITVDETGPMLFGMDITGVRVQPGLLKDTDGQVWFVSMDNERWRIDNPPQECVDAAKVMADLSVIPIKQFVDEREERQAKGLLDCSLHGPPGEMMFISTENHISVTWQSFDSESGIQETEFSIGSTPGPSTDILPSTGTSRHRHIETYHPDLGDSKVFYLHVRAKNGAGMETVMTAGPITVKPSAPVFSADLQLNVITDDEGQEYVMTAWNMDDYDNVEIQSGYIKDVQFAIVEEDPTTSTSKTITAVQPIVIQSSIPSCSVITVPPTCLVVSLASMGVAFHPGHRYLVQLGVESVTGLRRLARSGWHLHPGAGLQTQGVVIELDVNEGVDSDEPQYDIDTQSSTTRLHVAWSGFSISPGDTLEVGVGSNPGNDNMAIFRAVSADNEGSLMLTGLNLQPYQTVYSVVHHTSQGQASLVSSDGITVLPEDVPLQGFVVKDGSKCFTTGETVDTAGDTPHEEVSSIGSCGQEQDYGVTTSAYSAFWTLPDNITQFIRAVEWQLEESEDGSTWRELREWKDLGICDSHTEVSLHLTAGFVYRSAVKVCHREGCFVAEYTNGMTIYPDPPAIGAILSVELSNTRVETTVQEVMSPLASISWSLSSDGAQFTSWFDVDTWSLDEAAQLLTFTADLPSPLEPSACIRLSVRIRNPAGLFSKSVSTPLVGCKPDDIKPLPVIDAVGKWEDEDRTLMKPITLKKNTYWSEADREFTGSRDQLSAVWPSLRHGNYSWKVVSMEDAERVAFFTGLGASGLDYDTYHCAAPETLACGHTTDNFVNVANLPLQEGPRYHVCVHADESQVTFEKFEQHLERVSACSNGIVVDRSPPQAGQVWIGEIERHQYYQTTAHELRAYWSPFTDVEEHGNSGFHTALRKYEVAVGSSPYGVDVLEFDDVGITNSAVFTSLTLQQGQQYYVTVRATDHVGLSTVVTSRPVTVDTSHPLLTGVALQARFTVEEETESVLLVNWDGVFKDDESDIHEYTWCIGSRAGYCDVTPMTTTTDKSLEVTQLDVLDGHHCFVTVTASNGAGLTRSITSDAILKDTSPPSIEAIYDVTENDRHRDIDYQVDMTTLHVAIQGLHEPHAVIITQYYSLGKCPGCDDVIAEHKTGISNDLTMTDLTLVPGVRYYSTVTVCSSVGLCVTRVSDGVVADPSPPQPGKLRHGLAGEDRSGYQRSRDRISVHWSGVYDRESGIARVELGVGRSPGGTDVLPMTAQHHGATSSATLLLPEPLDEGAEIYVTLRVTNNAGLSAETSTDSIRIDSTPPSFITSPYVDTTFGSLIQDTQILLSSVKVHWQSSDAGGGQLMKHYVSLVPADDAAKINTPAIQVGGTESQHTFSNVSLSDGHAFIAHVVSCDAAMFCTEVHTSPILVDNSPPHVGAFAIRSEHAAMHTRHREDWMTYTLPVSLPANLPVNSSVPENSSLSDNSSLPVNYSLPDSLPIKPSNSLLNLAWLGFGDPHSDIAVYHVRVGTDLELSDLLIGEDGEVMGQHDHVIVGHLTDDPHEDEGYVQKHSFEMSRELVPNEEIVVSIIAENTVGLRSESLVGRFVTVASGQEGNGTLMLVRRCDIHTCHGHCTCAPHGHLYCDAVQSCTDLSGLSPPFTLTINNVLSLDPQAEDADYTHSQCVLMARWSPTTPDATPWMIEWSVSVEGASPGQGIMEPQWRDVWHEDGKVAIFTTESSSVDGFTLQPHVTYIFHMRVWYDAATFAVFTSDGVQTDSLPPELSSSRKVKETSAASFPADTDFLAVSDDLTVSWENVFRDNHVDIAEYKVYIGTYPSGDNVLREDVAVSLTSRTWSVEDLGLQSGIYYYTSVKAINLAGLESVAHGDGFEVDSSPPQSGTVWDGLGLHDASYSPDDLTLSVSLSGFWDPESYVARYEWCVGSGDDEDAVVTCHSIGRRTQATYILNSPLPSGTMVYSSIYAVNGAGLRSSPVKTNGVTIDSTPPEKNCRIKYNFNLFHNPNFDDDLATGWTVHNVPEISTSATGVRYVSLMPQSRIEQTAVTAVDRGKYRVTVVARPGEGSVSPSHMEVNLAGHKQLVVLESDNATEWRSVYLYFYAHAVTSSVQISAKGNNNRIDVSSVTVQQMTCAESTEEADTIDVHVHHSSTGESSITATWVLPDLESPMLQYRWAVGYVAGGTQVLDFVSTGKHDHAHLPNTYLQHGTRIYVTVVAYNAAGLVTSVTSRPVVIDKTAPALCCLAVGQGGARDQDLKYVSPGEVTLSWDVKDEESGVDVCSYGVGHSPDSYDLLGPTVSSNPSSQDIDLNTLNLVHGDTAFFTIKCTNPGGQSSTITSSVRIASHAPDVTNARLFVLASSRSRFPTRGQQQADNSSVVVGWTGVTDDVSGVNYNQVKLASGGQDLTDWTSTGLEGEMFMRLSGLNLPSETAYNILMRSVSHAGLISDTISTTFTVDQHPPTSTGVAPTITWPKEWTVKMDWSDSFTSASQLIYQVSIGNEVGGMDVLQWKETDVPRLQVSGMDSSKTHHVTITAINMAGLYTSATYPFQHTP